MRTQQYQSSDSAEVNSNGTTATYTVSGATSGSCTCDANVSSASVSSDGTLTATLSSGLTSYYGEDKQFTVGVPFRVTVDGLTATVYKNLTLTAYNAPTKASFEKSAITVSESDARTEYSYKLDSLGGKWEYVAGSAASYTIEALYGSNVTTDPTSITVSNGNVVITFPKAAYSDRKYNIRLQVRRKNTSTNAYVDATLYLYEDKS